VFKTAQTKGLSLFEDLMGCVIISTACNYSAISC